MPKHITFSKADIIESAFEIFKYEGLPGVSARKIAARLNSSTAPVYTSFNSIDALKNHLLEKAMQLLLTYTEREYTPDIFLNIGVGMLEFAKDYRVIYRTMFIESNAYKYILEEFTSKNLVQMKKEKSLEILSDEDLKDILNKLTIFTHGLASFICAGMLEDTSLENMINKLMSVGSDIIGATEHKRGLLEDYMNCSNKGGCQHEKNHNHQWND